jgi:hypothetical protein
MSPSLRGALASHLIRLLASSQAFGMVVRHAGWMLLAAATWGGDDGAGGASSFTAPIVRAFVWLGGVDESGHGDATSIMLVWGKLSLLVHLLYLLYRRATGERRPRRIATLALVSGAIALAGWLLALWPTAIGIGEAGIAAMFAMLTAAATAWALGARRVADALLAALERRAATLRP